MGNRKRVNMSVDSDTYDRLLHVKAAYRFRNLCELVTAMARVMLDRLETRERRRYDLPDDDARYIDSMFDELGRAEREPDGTVPVRRHRKTIK